MNKEDGSDSYRQSRGAAGRGRGARRRLLLGCRGDPPRVPGVIDTDVGYTGGWLENPTYHDTHDSKSGHAEAIRVTFDPAVLSYEDLLEKWFFKLHDPTTLNRQGNDVGTQYRSAIFPQTPRAGGRGRAGEGARRRRPASGSGRSRRRSSPPPPGTAPRSTTRTTCGSTRAGTPATTCAD